METRAHLIPSSFIMNKKVALLLLRTNRASVIPDFHNLQFSGQSVSKTNASEQTSAELFQG